jgi:isopenicillin-N N-acyltransferase-like protein
MSTTDDDWSTVAKPFHVRCYEILQQRELATAVAVIEGEPRACSANFLIAQLPDQVLNIEAAPQGTRRHSWAREIVVHANHFVDPVALGVEEPPDQYRTFSCRREARLQSLLQSRQMLFVSDLKRFLGDHTNAPRSICRHVVEDAPVDEQYRTVTSVIMDLQAGLFFYTDGPPCSNAYRFVALRSSGMQRARQSDVPERIGHAV